MHQTVGIILRTELYSNRPQNITQARDVIYSALETAIHATRANISTTLDSNPGALAFIRDIFLNIYLISDWQAIHKHREHYVNENLCPANLKRRQDYYAQGHKFLKKVYDSTKLVVITIGTYTIERVHVNRNINMEIRPGINERINIWRVVRFRWIFSTYPSEDKSPI